MPHFAATFSLLALLAAAPAAAGEAVWAQIAQLFGSDTGTQDSFGERVAIDGDTLVVSAFRKDGETGAVYVFERSPEPPTQWLETKKLMPEPGDSIFGEGIAVSGDTIAVLALTTAGTATYFFDRDMDRPGAWGLAGRIVTPEGGLGDLDGHTFAYSHSRATIGGLLEAGQIHMFERGPDGPADWRYLDTLTASDPEAQDHFGSRTALSGERMLVGVPDNDDLGISSGAAYVFERDATGEWMEVVKLLRPDGDDSDDFGAALDLDVDAALVAGDANGGREAGFVFERDDLTGTWVFTQELRPSDTDGSDAFGAAAGISGDVAVVGMPSFEQPEGEVVGAITVFERHQGGTGAWGEVAMLLLDPPPDRGSIGDPLALDRNTLVAGQHNAGDAGFDAGTVYLFSRTEPLLSVTGSCPGELAVSVIGTTPGGPVVVLGAEAEGITPIPVGPCAGTELGLEDPRPLFADRATSGGDLTVAPPAGAGTCGTYLQAVDVGTCLTTGVRRIA